MANGIGSQALAALRTYLAFEVAVLKDAWARAAATFPLEVKRWPQYAFLFLCGATIYASIKGLSALWDEVASTISFGVLGVAAAFFIVLLFNIFVAPYRLWAGRGTQEKAMRDELETLKSAATARSANLALAKEIEKCVNEGHALVLRWSDLHDNDSSVTEWYERALQLTGRVSEEERSMFATLTSPPWTQINRKVEKEAMEARVNKLRLIMSRQFARAEGPA